MESKSTVCLEHPVSRIEKLHAENPWVASIGTFPTLHSKFRQPAWWVLCSEPELLTENVIEINMINILYSLKNILKLTKIHVTVHGRRSLMLQKLKNELFIREVTIVSYKQSWDKKRLEISPTELWLFEVCRSVK